jgi:hypothetical protein
MHARSREIMEQKCGQHDDTYDSFEQDEVTTVQEGDLDSVVHDASL